MTVTADGLSVLAPAKLNLNLLVGPRRADGYHGLDSIVTKISLYDRVMLSLRQDGRIVFTCHLSERLLSDGVDCGRDDNNLAYRAADLIARQAGRGRGAQVRLFKNIPPGQGMGGGSSDAAAVLAGLNELWQLKLGSAELSDMAGRLGSDVPLFLGGPSGRMTGRGERVAPLEVYPFFAVVVMPAVGTSTAAVYARFDQLRLGRDLSADEQLPPSLLVQPPSYWRRRLCNDLAVAAKAVCPELDRLWRQIMSAVEVDVFLTGSGSALFVPCDDLAEARSIYLKLPSEVICRSVIVRQNDW